MIGLTVNTKGVKDLQTKLDSFKTPESVNTDKMLRTIATSVCALVRTRVHEDGINSKGQPIGVYSKSYLEFRQRNNYDASSKVILSLTRQMQNDFGIGATNPTKLSEGGYGLGFKNPDNAIKAETLQNGMPAHNVSQHSRNMPARQMKERSIPAHERVSKDGKAYKVKAHTVKAHTVKAHTQEVGSYYSKGWKGYGDVYKLTSDEREKAMKIAQKFINNAFKGQV